MNERERVLAVLRHEQPDRVPWLARLELWYAARLATGTLPERFSGYSLWDINRELGIGIRTVADVVTLRQGGFAVRQSRRGDESITIYDTPLGSVRTVTTLNEAMRLSGVNHPYTTEFFIKDVADYDVLEYVYEHTRPEPCYESYLQVAAQLGGDGLVLSGRVECPFQNWLLRMAGYETGFAHLMDHTERVERFLRFLTDWTLDVCKVVVASPAEMILSGDNFSGIITHGRLFRTYCLPYLQAFSADLHARGKWLASHIDGETASLLQVFAESGVDVAECFTPWPMTQTTLAQAQAAWGDRVTIWGGVPSAILCPSTPQADYERFVDEHLRPGIARGNIILGVGDNVVADALLERVIDVTTWIRRL